MKVEQLFDRASSGDRRALGRLLTLIERGGEESDAVTDLAHPLAGSAHVIGITGAPGSGKSTLTGQLLAEIAATGRRPAVLAVDPSSPLTGGAILGDRIRMDDLAGPDTFIRSMATHGHQGGLALAAPGAIRLLDAAGFDPVIVETVGVGQVDVDVAGTADTTLVVVTPGWGDAIQANKAGLLEVADVFVVNKADRPGANDARRDLEFMLDLSHITGQESSYRPEIIMTTATEGTGVDKVWAALEAHVAHISDTGELAARRSTRLHREVRDRIEQLLAYDAERRLLAMSGAAVLADVEERRLSPVAAASAILNADS